MYIMEFDTWVSEVAFGEGLGENYWKKFLNIDDLSDATVLISTKSSFQHVEITLENKKLIMDITFLGGMEWDDFHVVMKYDPMFDKYIKKENHI